MNDIARGDGMTFTVDIEHQAAVLIDVDGVTGEIAIAPFEPNPLSDREGVQSEFTAHQLRARQTFGQGPEKCGKHIVAGHLDARFAQRDGAFEPG